MKTGSVFFTSTKRQTNMMLEQAKAMLELVKQEVRCIQYSKTRNVTVSVKNEVIEMNEKVEKRKGRLDLPIVSGKRLRKISDRTALQSANNAEKFCCQGHVCGLGNP